MKKIKSNFPEFVKLCMYDQRLLKKALTKELKSFYDDVISEDGFIFVKGTIPILLTAHMDTVHKETVKEFVEQKHYNEDTKRIEHMISSPQGIGGDDRCGIYMILTILKTTELRPYILFCEDEEIGGVGSDKFVLTEHVKEIENLKYYIELDRANVKDAVFYNCGNTEFMSYVLGFGFDEDYGSFSDISNLSPVTDVASVNLSCGYYKAHTLAEYVIPEEMLDTIEKVINMLEDVENAEEYDYQEIRYSRYGEYGCKYYDYSSYFTNKKYYDLEQIIITYQRNGEKKSEVYDYDGTESEYEILARFLMDHPTVCYNDVISFDAL